MYNKIFAGELAKKLSNKTTDNLRKRVKELNIKIINSRGKRISIEEFKTNN